MILGLLEKIMYSNASMLCFSNQGYLKEMVWLHQLVETEVGVGAEAEAEVDEGVRE